MLNRLCLQHNVVLPLPVSATNQASRAVRVVELQRKSHIAGEHNGSYLRFFEV